MDSDRTKFIVIDDDQNIGEMLVAVAQSQGIECEHFTSLLDLGSFAKLKNYDLAIIDYYLESLRGDEIAAYVDTFFHDIPVIIISGKDFGADAAEGWPAPVKQFVSKAEGAVKIIETAKTVLERVRLLRKFQDGTGRPEIVSEPARESGL